VTLKQVEEIAKQKMPDLNAASVDAAIKSVRGTARSMGIEVVDKIVDIGFVTNTTAFRNNDWRWEAEVRDEKVR